MTARLTIELVPSSAWGKNLRKILSPRDWDAVRRACYRRAGHRCECCGGVGPTHPVECHEIWDYDEAWGIQWLSGVTALCPTCHQVKHWGRSLAVATDAFAERERLGQHLMRVNGWTEAQVTAHERRVFAWWRLASARPWSLDIHAYLSMAQEAGEFTLHDYQPPAQQEAV